MIRCSASETLGEDAMSSSGAIEWMTAACRRVGTRSNLSSLIPVFLFVALAGGCTTLPVSVDYDPSVSFSELRTFAFLPDPPPQSPAAQLHNGLVDGRVSRAIRQQMEARGFEEVAADEANFLVSHHIGTKRGFEVRTIQTAHHYSRRHWSTSGVPHTSVIEYERGTLLIDILLPAERTLVWSGSASARLRERSSPAQREQRINDAVARILERFPPDQE
jgi:hypothetical protein